jgi:hypothetical protein
MREKIYYYSILYYKPDYASGEQITIGVFYWFVEDDACRFIYPDNLQRAKLLYPYANFDTLRQYLNRYAILAENFKPLFRNTSNIEEVITLLYGSKNAVNFIFDKPKIGSYENIGKTIPEQKATYFANYNFYEGKKIK